MLPPVVFGNGTIIVYRPVARLGQIRVRLETINAHEQLVEKHSPSKILKPHPAVRCHRITGDILNHVISLPSCVAFAIQIVDLAFIELS